MREAQCNSSSCVKVLGFSLSISQILVKRMTYALKMKNTLGYINQALCPDFIHSVIYCMFTVCWALYRMLRVAR